MTWALRAQRARDLVSRCVPVHTTQFCDSELFRVTVWTLFRSTGHRVKKKKKFFKNCIVYDLKYEIFILKLL